MRSPIIRSIVRERSAVIENGRVVVHTWNGPAWRVPGLIGVKTGHTGKAGWCQVAAVRRLGYTIYAVILGSPTRAQRNEDLERLLAWSVSQYRALALVRRTTYAWAAVGYGRSPVPLVAAGPFVRVIHVGRPLVERVIAPGAVSLPVTRGERLGGSRSGPAGSCSAPAHCSPPGRFRAPVSADGYGGTPPGRFTISWRLLMIVTVTLNAAVDRTLTVPNFQLGHRHRASASLTSAGGKGVNVGARSRSSRHP